MRVIVLNCYSRNSLAVINSLDPSYEIIGGAARKEKYLFMNPDKFFKSPRLSFIFRYTDPIKDSEGFKKDIIYACNAYKADAVIPTGTTITNYLSYFKEEISRNTDAKLLVENYSVLSQLTDKWLTYSICIKLGIPAPKTVLLKTKDDVECVLDTFSFPVVIKPRISYAAKGVLFFNTPERFAEYISEVSKLTSSYIAQEAIKEELHDVTLCAKEGEILSLLTQQRLVSLYDFGGGGIVNKTTYEPDLMEYARHIVRYMKWNGVMEIDFIRKGSQYYLLECNPKIWGTTHLTVKAGLNVVQQLVDVFVLNKPVYEVKQDKYNIGLLYRWIFPESVFNWFQKPRKINVIVRRIINTFRSYGAEKAVNNLNLKDIHHLIGILLDKSEL